MKKSAPIKRFWLSIPVSIRKPVVFVVGWFFIIAAGLLGWLPGPGGIPLFLIGITILSTEFEWAERLKQYSLKLIKDASLWIKSHVLLSFLILILSIGSMVLVYKILK